MREHYGVNLDEQFEEMIRSADNQRPSADEEPAQIIIQEEPPREVAAEYNDLEELD